MTKKLGFGCMRLPQNSANPEDINMDEFKKMADEFIDHGFTYFDTSYVYHNGKSENAVKEAVVERHPRDSFTLATKFPTFFVQSEDQVDSIFEQQLKNLGTDYIDYYLLHTLNTKFYDGMDGKGGVVKSCHLFDHMKKWKEEGKIKHMGFSFHDSPELLDRILTDHPEVEFVQIILNYFDWDSRWIESKRNYDVIRKHGKKVVVMEPVKGGFLANLPEKEAEKLKEIDPNVFEAGMALLFPASHEDVLVVLSGMSNEEQMMDNIHTFDECKPLTKEQMHELVEIGNDLRESGPEHTRDFSKYEGLTYHGIPVADILDAYNALMLQPIFGAESNYLSQELLKEGITDVHHEFAPETVMFEGKDITDHVKEAWDLNVAKAL